MTEFINLYGGAMMPSMMPPGQMPPGGVPMPPGGAPMPPGQMPGSTTTTPPGSSNVGVGAKKNNSKNGNTKKNNSKNGNIKKNNTKNGNNKSNNAKSNNAKNNNKSNYNNKKDGNNTSNSLSNNNQNALNNLNNDIREKIAGIKLTDNYQVIAFWVCWFLSILVVLSTFITTPIRYSEEEPIYKVSYNRMYYYVTILMVVLSSLYVYKARKRNPLIYGEDIYTMGIPIAVLFLSFIIINIFDSPGETENGSFNTPASTLVKNKKVMIFQYVLLLMLLIAMVILDLNKSANGLTNVESYHIKRTIPGLIVIIIVVYFLYNTVKYNVKKYNLPETWRK
jgi:hypothetical protein